MMRIRGSGGNCVVIRSEQSRSYCERTHEDILITHEVSLCVIKKTFFCIYEKKITNQIIKITKTMNTNLLLECEYTDYTQSIVLQNEIINSI